MIPGELVKPFGSNFLSRLAQSRAELLEKLLTQLGTDNSGFSLENVMTVNNHNHTGSWVSLGCKRIFWNLIAWDLFLFLWFICLHPSWSLGICDFGGWGASTRSCFSVRFNTVIMTNSPSLALCDHLRKQGVSNVQSAESMLSLLAPSLTSPARLWFPAVT